MKLTICLGLALLASVPQIAWSLDTTGRLVGPTIQWDASKLDRFDGIWCEVKFVEGSDVRWESNRFVDDSGLDLQRVHDALAVEQVVQVRPTFRFDRATLRQWKAVGEARSGAAGPDLSLWFDVRVEGGKGALARLINALNDLPEVEIAHPVPLVEPAVAYDPGGSVAPIPAAPAGPRRTETGAEAMAEANPLTTPDFTSLQGYLYNPPSGLFATSAWSVAGGLGQGTRFIDVELAWTEEHEEFNAGNLFYVGGAEQDPSGESHGTAVLGEIIGMHNGLGVRGFAPAARWGVVAVTISEWPVVPQYFQEAMDQLSFGDIWLIELQMFPPERSATPMEYLQVNFDVIWTSTFGRGIICVEAGANGGQDLDNPSWGGLFDRNQRDSGAIMVGAGTPVGLVAESFSNYGSRMDVHAWGSGIVTTGYGDLYNGGNLRNRYTSGFNGTSGASPMIVGSALCMQGIALARVGGKLDPIALRTVLHDTGTPQAGTRLIGPRPNLQRCWNAIVGTTGSDVVVDIGPGHGAFPNPFVASTEIRFSMQRSEATQLQIFDTSGRLVRDLYAGVLGAGAQALTWDSRDNSGRSLQSGVYFYRIVNPEGSRTGRVAMVR